MQSASWDRRFAAKVTLSRWFNTAYPNDKSPGEFAYEKLCLASFIFNVV
jgi:hypothetical protein